MCCNTKPGPKKAITFITQQTGVPLTQKDWHACRSAAEKKLGRKLSPAYADRLTMEGVAEQLITTYGGGVDEKKAFLEGFTSERNTQGTCDTLRFLAENGLPATVIHRRRNGENVENVENEDHSEVNEYLLSTLDDDAWLETLNHSTFNRYAPIMAERLETVDIRKIRYLLGGPVPASFLEVVSGHSSVRIRSDVARHPNNSLEVYDRLLSDPTSGVLLGIGGNKSAPPEVLTVVARSNNVDARASVAGNPSTPVEVINVLAVDRNKLVRAGVGRNSVVKNETLAVLAADKTPLVRGAVGGNLNAGTSTLGLLARDADISVRASVAANPSSPVDVINVLAVDDSPLVRAAVGRNRSISVGVLRALAQDSDQRVTNAVMNNGNTPKDIRSILIKNYLKLQGYSGE